jgi:carbonic anhydrase
VSVISAAQALDRLREGNRRFVSGNLKRTPEMDHVRRADLVDEQSPFAVILGCSDSRVPAEMVFDQGIGDLFVIRVAGNIVAPSQIGSIEFAAEQFGTQLVVVMGHSNCGAVKAAIDQMGRSDQNGSPNVGFIVERIQPNIRSLVEGGAEMGEEELVSRAVQANIQASVDELMAESSVLKSLTENRGLRIMGAEYSLATGVVTFLGEPA